MGRGGGELFRNVTTSAESEDRWLVRVDTGGTFTDGWARRPDGTEKRCKVLSSGVLRAAVEECLGGGKLRLSGDFGADDGVLRGFSAAGQTVTHWERRAKVVTLEGDRRWRVGDVLELSTGEEAPVVAARLLTCTAPGADFPSLDFRLATTRGTNALLERKGQEGVLLVTAGFEDLLTIRDQRRPDLFAMAQTLPPPVFHRAIGVHERISSEGEVLASLEELALREALASARREGVTVAAVALLNSYANPVHERRVAELLEEEGFTHVSLSTELTRRMRLLPRAETAAANAYLAPMMERFVSRVGSGLGQREFDLMTSAGFLKTASSYQPVDSLLSGPAAGVIGALAAGGTCGRGHVLAFDMGGTSTDVARLEGVPALRYAQTIGPVRVVAPAVKIETVAAGGGSICRWHKGGLEVGPESAGADPGPACYGRGGPLTITDVNLLLGCMDAEKAGIPLDRDVAQAQLDALQHEMRDAGADPGEERDLLEGLREIAVERMADAIRRVSLREGYDPGAYTLVAFGGAGPQHACSVAEKLGIGEILVPGDAGLLSAWGLHRSTREQIAERQVLCELGELEQDWAALVKSLAEESCAGLGAGAQVSRSLVEVRLLGQESAIEIDYEDLPLHEDVERDFHEKYESLYGYRVPEGRSLEVVAVRIVGAVPAPPLPEEHFREPQTVDRRTVMQDAFRTCVLESGWSWAEGSQGSLRLALAAPKERDEEWTREVESELYRCRFESVVEEMGELLRRTAISTNVKERLDFSCALLDAEGRLVVNAPHIPVHLGALGICVREVSRERSWQEGDMVVVNHPGYGGSHLPDITVISPVFSNGVLLAFVANRAHHAEIGGRTPGSMPAEASCLEEEGVVIVPQLLFAGGIDRFGEIEKIFRSATYPSRMLEDNLADLAAQGAANRHGVQAVQELAERADCETVTRNMTALRDRASTTMAGILAGRGERTWQAQDALDDGTPVCVTLRSGEGRLVVDFSGSGGVHPGNLNATPAIVRSAVLYVLRCWAGENLPLNEGLLDAVAIEIPSGLLNPPFADRPEDCPAVVGGNVETSQRVVDVLFEALELQAHSQGTMNNVLFGGTSFGYYETIGGGSGAGPGWDGLSGTHVHMSNTAITDAEVLERRFPIRVRKFSLRPGSGGDGHWRGGDGLVRELEFLEAMTISFLTQRRHRAPRGCQGGEDGMPGRQVLLEGDQEEELAPVCSFEIEAGQRVRIETPGGGGWGIPDR